ncbi:hypothetical protein CBR_g23012 [Chara braunii]|uniref:Reverse transcriptase domain-containing protein n=1 Tax=Chara braunii TaxID=69332 RepID=A0A388L3C3_CHABU|nr:hypothetical protein CBR_g23012 [Chara braunii]|eukprot:GBG76797.1 hypothetical protein CBR_g23012 [Chara braunii]
MAGHGDNRDYGSGSRNPGGGGRDYDGYREYEVGTVVMTGTGEMAAIGVKAVTEGSAGLDRTRRILPIDPLESKVSEIGKSVTAVCQYVEVEQQKKASKERRKAERKESEERAAAERAEAELIKKKKEDKARKEVERKEEIHKSLDIKMAVRVGELRENVREDIRSEIREAIGELCRVVSHGKEKVVEVVKSGAESSASSSETDELSMHTRNLCITEKRKRGPETAVEGSPPMELPPKRTPKRTPRQSRFDGLVFTPLDRNPGETVVMCPKINYEAMMDMFIRSTGYTIITSDEKVVLLEIKEDMKAAGLQQFVRWDNKGTLDSAYVIPKHKDLTRYRPIWPTYNEPMVRTSRVVARGLNFLLSKLPTNDHFNLPAVSQLTAKLNRVNTKIRRLGSLTNLTAQTFDIKDMFSRLPHVDIMKAVRWLLNFHSEKGHTFMRVNTRGRGASFGLTTRADHWRKVEFVDLCKFVEIALQHTYTHATTVLLRQDVGIPMGKSTSPPLACILCAYAKVTFLRSLGRYAHNVFGIRLMDDVLLVVASLSGVNDIIEVNSSGATVANMVIGSFSPTRLAMSAPRSPPSSRSV